MIERWRCEVCKTPGSVRFKANSGVWEVVMKISDDHTRRSKHCQARLSDLRLLPKERRPTR